MYDPSNRFGATLGALQDPRQLLYPDLEQPSGPIGQICMKLVRGVMRFDLDRPEPSSPHIDLYQQ